MTAMKMYVNITSRVQAYVWNIDKAIIEQMAHRVRILCIRLIDDRELAPCINFIVKHSGMEIIIQVVEKLTGQIVFAVVVVYSIY